MVDKTPLDSMRLLAIAEALANAHRLRALATLVEGREYVSELARRLRISRPLLHMHLEKLERAGLVQSTLELSQEGKAMKYYEVKEFDIRLAPETIARALARTKDGER